MRLEKENKDLKGKTKDVERIYQEVMIEQEEYIGMKKGLEEKIGKLEKRIEKLKEEGKNKESEIASVKELLAIKEQQIKV